MARRKRKERTIFFPWERQGGLLRLPWLRSRPLMAALFMMTLLALLGMRQRDQVGIRTTRATLIVVREAIDAYRSDHQKRCPESLATLRDEGYLVIAPEDAWGRPFHLTCPGRRHPDGYDLVSYGPSGDVQGLERIE